MSDSTVYMVQEPAAGRDLSSAQRYGKLVSLLSLREQASLTPGPSLFKLQKLLRDFNPDKDYVCFPGGDPMALALTMLTLRDMNFREIQYLRWERERSIDGERFNNRGFYLNVSVPLRA